MRTTTAPVVEILTLGGTIAMIAADDGGLVPALSARDLLATLPDLTDRVQLRAESFRQRPGASLTFDDLLALNDRIARATADGAAGVVVSQGTDTLEETAYFLDLVVDVPEPVVLTGAMRPAEAPGADGPANLYAATLVAASNEMRGCGSVVVLDDQIHSSAQVQKVRASGPGAFASPDTGPLGWVVEGEPRLLALRNDRLRPPAVDPDVLRASPVAVVPITLGEDPRLLASLRELGYAGVVVEAMGAGHVPAWIVDPLAALAEDLPVVLASRSGAGRVHTRTYGFPGSETDLIARGLTPAGHLDGRRARILLAVLIAGGVPRDAFAGWFDRT